MTEEPRANLVERLLIEAASADETAASGCNVQFVEPMKVWDDYAALFREAAAALSLRPAETRVKVKPLEWDQLRKGEPETLRANGLAYEIRIDLLGRMKGTPRSVAALVLEAGESYGDYLGYFDTPEEAEAFCQSDFEKRIKASISEPARAEEGKEPVASDGIGEFKPCITINEEVGITEATFEDVPYVTTPVFDGIHHWIDKHVAMDDGRIVGMAVWATTPPSRPSNEAGE